MTNVVIGKSKTVHNTAARNMDGERVPSCSVRTGGKTVTETDAAVTCKTCLKTRPASEAAPATGYESVELADVTAGDEIFAGGSWAPVKSVKIFGSKNDLAKITFAHGGTQSGPVHHMGKARRAVAQEAAPALPVVTRKPVTHDAADCPELAQGDTFRNLGDLPTCGKCRAGFLAAFRSELAGANV